jgi:hypothetical protein
MPASRCVIPFFVIFGNRTMGVCRKSVLPGGFLVCVVHGFSPSGSAAPFRVTSEHDKDRTSLDGAFQRG